ncbi:TPA: hypothetical protein VDU83_002761 [Pseudomonas aeruginosa]|nr:hypothetical protein [Pseudomonas aeruginosa]
MQSNIHLQNINPAIELNHYEEVMQQRQKQLFGDLVMEGHERILLLDPEQRAPYLVCKAAVKEMEMREPLASKGVKTPEDHREFIQLVHDLSTVYSAIPASELRGYSLDLLRSMEKEAKSRLTA